MAMQYNGIKQNYIMINSCPVCGRNLKENENNGL